MTIIIVIKFYIQLNKKHIFSEKPLCTDYYEYLKNKKVYQEIKILNCHQI